MTLLGIVFLFIGPLLNAAFEPSVYAQASSNWGQFHGDASHNGFSNSAGPTNPVEIWNYSTGNANVGLIVAGGDLLTCVPGDHIYELSEQTGVSQLTIIAYEPGAITFSREFRVNG